VVVVPPHRPCIRDDRDDAVFTQREAKENALLEEIGRVHETGRPILVGTASVQESERLAIALAGRRIDCSVLNAKNDEREAEIVAEAGASMTNCAAAPAARATRAPRASSSASRILSSPASA